MKSLPIRNSISGTTQRNSTNNVQPATGKSFKLLKIGASTRFFLTESATDDTIANTGRVCKLHVLPFID